MFERFLLEKVSLCGAQELVCDVLHLLERRGAPRWRFLFTAAVNGEILRLFLEVIT